MIFILVFTKTSTHIKSRIAMLFEEIFLKNAKSDLYPIFVKYSEMMKYPLKEEKTAIILKIYIYIFQYK